MMASKECSARLADDIWSDGFIAAWNAQAGFAPSREDAVEPYRTCTLCMWNDHYHGRCLKDRHRACPDWEPLG